MSKDAEQLNRIMQILKVSRAEALQIIADDQAIDRGERMSFDLPKEQEKQAKKYANVTTHKASANAKPRERKPDEEKESIIAELARFLQEKYGNATITNKNNEIQFTLHENRYKIKMSKTRGG
jgi:hypothetical protein